MFGSRLFGGPSSAPSVSVGSSLQSLLTQLQARTNPESDTYEHEMRAHVAIEYVSQISERLSLVANGEEEELTHA